jgi:hypothetical protein
MPCYIITERTVLMEFLLSLLVSNSWIPRSLRIRLSSYFYNRTSWPIGSRFCAMFGDFWVHVFVLTSTVSKLWCVTWWICSHIAFRSLEHAYKCILKHRYFINMIFKLQLFRPTKRCRGQTVLMLSCMCRQMQQVSSQISAMPDLWDKYEASSRPTAAIRDRVQEEIKQNLPRLSRQGCTNVVF